MDWLVGAHRLQDCGHVFCACCLAPWLEQRASCPTCRAAPVAVPKPDVLADGMVEAMLEQHVLGKDEIHALTARMSAWTAEVRSMPKVCL